MGLHDVDSLDRVPLFILVFSFFAMWFSAKIGSFLHSRTPTMDEGVRRDLDLIVAASLTLLSLVIGFSFSMALGRYDQRKNYEEAEANAIGTEYVRADLLPASDAASVRPLLKDYLDQRIAFYETSDERELKRINVNTVQLQAKLWSAVQGPAAAQPTSVLALVVSGMNDVLNSQVSTQSAWWNRIPFSAWILMLAIAICSNLLLGYSKRGNGPGDVQLMALPLILSIAFFLTADIDSPRRGMIRVLPHNLSSLVQSMHGH